MVNNVLPSALTEGIQRLSLESFRETGFNWRMVSRKVEANDFRDQKAIRMNANTGLVLMAPGGQIKHGTLSESAFPFRVETYARMLTVTRNDLINDDLSLFDQLPLILASEGSRLCNDLIFDQLAGGLAANFFAAGNSNLLTGGTSALSITSLGTAIRTLRTQKDSDGRLIGFQPATLIVPAALEATARQILASIEVARVDTGDNLPTGNPWAGMNLQLVVEPRLDANSATAWYLGSKPEDGALLAAFLRGVEGPQVEDVILDGSYLGRGWRAYLDAGASRGEPKAIVRANGA
jgi:hypothetical protein